MKALGSGLLRTSALALLSLVFLPSVSCAATIVSGDITTDATWTTADSPYIVQLPFTGAFDYIPLTIQPGVTLTIEPGVIVKFADYNGMKVYGTLRAQGTAAAPVYFTSIADDTVGGDADGMVVEPADAQWVHLQFENGSTGEFTHAVVRYGGQQLSVAPMTGIANDGGTVTIDHTRLTRNGYDGLAVFSGTTMVRDSEFDHHIVGINHQYPGGTLTIESSKIHDNGRYGVLYAFGSTHITGSEIYGNDEGLRAEYEGTLSIRGSSIRDNALIGAAGNAGSVLDAVGNWWGPPTGPFQYPSNLTGTGNAVANDVLFAPFLTEDPFSATPPAHCTPGTDADCNSNVLFLPGIEASRLYMPDSSALDGNDRLWEPTSDADGRALFMDTTGTSIRSDIYTKDVIDEAYGTFNVYKSFLADLERWKNTDHIIADYSAVPYDWRLTLDEILEYGNQTPDGHIHYSGADRATSTPYIIQELARLAATSRTGKVTIVAHSNGGLVAKALIKKLQDTDDPLLDKIDVVVLVAVPQTGTPQALGAILHGYDQGLPKDWAPFFLSPQVAREFAYNDPMAHHLLPSASYFDGEGATVQTPLATFNNGGATQMFISRYGSTIDNALELHDFLLGAEGRPLAFADDLSSPTVLRAGLLSYGETAHQSLDTWTPPSHIAVHEVAGWGEDTMVGIIYDSDRKCVARTLFVCMHYTDTLRYKPDLAVDGDGTVVAPSALAMSTSSEQVKRWWVDLYQFNAEHRPTRILPNVNHASILEISELRSFIENMIIASSSSPLPRYVRDAIPPADDVARLRFFLHSPLALSATDAAGQEISASTSTIPGARYRRFGDVQYISLPASSHPTLRLDGYASGSFTLEVEEVAGDTVSATTTFLGIPNATTTTAQMSFDDGTIEHASPLTVDIDDDGTNDIALQPQAGEVVVPDITPPEIQITFATSTNALAFIGIDDMGTTTISATTTYPALKKNQKEPRGVATTAVTVRDQAGNTTLLIYTEKIPSPEKRDAILLKEISYNGATTTLSDTSVSYKWRTEKNGLYKLFASHIKTTSTSTESHYRPKKDLTVIMTKPQDLDDDDSDDNVDSRPIKERLLGMIIPSAVTEQGRVLVAY